LTRWRLPSCKISPSVRGWFIFAPKLVYTLSGLKSAARICACCLAINRQATGATPAKAGFVRCLVGGFSTSAKRMGDSLSRLSAGWKASPTCYPNGHDGHTKDTKVSLVSFVYPLRPWWFFGSGSSGLG